MRDHFEGFEKEELFHLILNRALDDCPTIKARAVKRIIHQVAPDFMDGLFTPRPCIRRLRFVGCGEVCCEFPTSEAPHENGLVLGHVYESELFNGATYKLRDHDGWIGAAHFEWVREEE
ncbi:MAG: hypothetical protein ABIM40_09810 [Pseudomonadota bacterium]